MNDEGVSEVIGYIIILSIVMISIGMAYSQGLPVIEQTTTDRVEDNALNTLESLRYNMYDITDENTPRKSTQFSLFRSTISMDSDSNGLEVQGNTSSNVPFVYEVGDRRYVYEHGAIISVSPNDSVMVREPDWKFGDGYSIISAHRLIGNGEITGNRGNIIVDKEISSRYTSIEDGLTLTVQSNSTYHAWESYFEDNGVFVSSPDGEATMEIPGTSKVLYNEDVIKVTLR